jgi:alkaline phosphatase
VHEGLGLMRIARRGCGVPTRSLGPTLFLLFAVALGGPAVSAAEAPADTTRPRNVVLLIPDGCGPSAIGLGRMVADRPLALDSILTGAIRTRSASSRVTDSAAAGSAMATGVKVPNGAIGMDPAGLPLGNLVEDAAAHGIATGVVTTASVTDATPATFTAHVVNRQLEDDIAAQQLGQLRAYRPLLLLGGGRRRFLPREADGTRTDGRDLLAEARRAGVGVALTRTELAEAERVPLLGLFAGDALDLELDRDPAAQPSLVELTEAALRLLGPAEHGFLLVVEGARPDDAEHDHDPAALAREVGAFDRALAAVLAFARRDGRTLVVVAPDHETGGLALGLHTAGADAHDVRPEALLGARASLWRMADSILAGADPVRTAMRGTGATDLTPTETRALRRARRRDDLLDVLSGIESRRALVGWSTGWHTAVDVGLWAWGPGSGRFRGLIENTDVARHVADLLGLDLAAATARLREAAAPR